MEQEDLFQVYIGKYLHSIGEPVIIAAADAKIEPMMYGEGFVLVGGKKPRMYPNRITFDRSGAPSFVLDEISLERMAEEGIRFARLVIYNHVEQNFDSESLRPFLIAPYELYRTDKWYLLRMWMRGEFNKELKVIAGMTKSSSLKEFIKSIVNVPPFEPSEELKPDFE